MISLYHHNKCHVATTEPVAKAIFFAKMNKSLRIRISISFKCLLTTWRVIVVTQPRDNSIQNGLCLLKECEKKKNIDKPLSTTANYMLSSGFLESNANI